METQHYQSMTAILTEAEVKEAIKEYVMNSRIKAAKAQAYGDETPAPNDNTEKKLDILPDGRYQLTIVTTSGRPA